MPEGLPQSAPAPAPQPSGQPANVRAEAADPLHELLLQATEAGEVALDLDSGGATLSIRETRAGGLALDVRVNQGALDIRAAGAAANLLAAHETDLRAALLGAGLRLGHFAVGASEPVVAAAAAATAPKDPKDGIEPRRRSRAEESDRDAPSGATPSIGGPAIQGSVHVKA